MKSLILILLLILKIFLLIISTVFFLLGVYEQIAGPAGLERLLIKLHIPLSYNQVFCGGLISLALLFAIHILRLKLSGKL